MTFHASFVFLFPECFVFIPGAFATVVLIRGTFDSEKEMKFDNVRFLLTIECPFVCVHRLVGAAAGHLQDLPARSARTVRAIPVATELAMLLYTSRD